MPSQTVAAALFTYWHGLSLCMRGRAYHELCDALPELTARERLCIYCWWLHLKLWNAPHYRSGTFWNDLRKNLRNVALPGTGLPLSALCVAWPVALVFVWFGIPLAAFGAAVIRCSRDYGALGAAFAEALLTDYSWFHTWRLNCALASYHALWTVRAIADPAHSCPLLPLRPTPALPDDLPTPSCPLSPDPAYSVLFRPTVDPRRTQGTRWRTSTTSSRRARARVSPSRRC